MSTRITRMDEDGWAYGEDGASILPHHCARIGITPETIPGTLHYIPDSLAEESHHAEAERLAYGDPRESHRQRLVEVALGEYIRATTVATEDGHTGIPSEDLGRLAVTAADAALKAEEE